MREYRYLGVDDLRQILTYHDDSKLLRQFNQTASISALKYILYMKILQASIIINLFVSESSEDVFVVAGVADKLSFEERDVDDGGIKVDKLEDEDFEGEIVVVLSLRAVHF